MGKIALILFLFATAFISRAAETNTYDPQKENYHCLVCGKGPLTGQIWIYPRGVVCDDCQKLTDRCNICGLPVLEGDGHLKTGDGRFICKYDAPNALMTVDQAQDLFAQVRDDVVDLYGPQFALKTTSVTVNMFDVDYWSEKGRTNDLHAFGFAHSRPADGGKWTHEIIMLSGRTRTEMTAVAAHEYTHLWINENRPPNHQIDADTIEAICELTAYKLMGVKKFPDQQAKILKNPYTNGKIKTLVAVEQEAGSDYILNWVKTGQAETFDADANLAPLPVPSPPLSIYRKPPPLPAGLTFSGVMVFGTLRQAVIDGVAFQAGEAKTVKLRARSVSVRCREIHDEDVMIELNNAATPVTLPRGKEMLVP